MFCTKIELNFSLMAHDGCNYIQEGWGGSLQNCDYQSEESVILTHIISRVKRAAAHCSLEEIISYDEMIPVIIQSLMFKVFVV